MDDPRMMEMMQNGETDDRIGYAVERGDLEQTRAMDMSYADKEDWLSRHDHDLDPY